MTETTDCVKVIKEKAFVQVGDSPVGCGGWVVLAQCIYIYYTGRILEASFFPVTLSFAYSFLVKYIE